MENQYSKIRLNSSHLIRTDNWNKQRTQRSTNRILQNDTLTTSVLEKMRRIINIPKLSRRTSQQMNTILKSKNESLQTKRQSRLKLNEYLQLINCKSSHVGYLQKDITLLYGFNSTNTTKLNQNQQNRVMSPIKRQVKTLLPYQKVNKIVSKIYKNFDILIKLRYSNDQVINIIRQICAKRRNLQLIFLNRKQKPKRLYYTYQLKKESQCIEIIIKQSIQNRNGKFQAILRDIGNFCSFFQDQIISRGNNRMKQIKKSILNMKQQLQCNEYSEQLGFNLYTKSRSQSKIIRSKLISQNKDALEYISFINKNMDEQLVKIDNQIGDFLDRNRNAVDVLAKVKKSWIK